MSEEWDWDTLYAACAPEGSDSDEQFVVEKILMKRTLQSGTEYLIKWLNYPDSDNSWEPAANLQCPDLLREFEANWTKQQEVHKKGPSRSNSGNSGAGPSSSPSKPIKPFTGIGHCARNDSSVVTGKRQAPTLQEETATTTTTSHSRTITTASTSVAASPVVSSTSTACSHSNSTTEENLSTKRPRIDHEHETEEEAKRREMLSAAEKRAKEQQERGLPDSAAFQRMKARQEAREKAEDKVAREGGFNPVLNWRV